MIGTWVMGGIDLSLLDNRLGTQTGFLAYSNPPTVNGDFSGVVVESGGGQLCTSDGNGGLKGKYVFSINDAFEVPVTELKGKSFLEYENCEIVGESTFNQDGTLTFSVFAENVSETVSAADVTKLFSKDGWDEGNELSKAKAYKYTDPDGVTKYYYLNNGNDIPFKESGDGVDNYVVFGIEGSLIN